MSTVPTQNGMKPNVVKRRHTQSLHYYHVPLIAIAGEGYWRLSRHYFLTARKIAIIIKESVKLLKTSLFLLCRDGLDI